jgi:acetylornithine deacetylase/succinyl-diaminopimelate desuccinylase-like protein
MNTWSPVDRSRWTVDPFAAIEKEGLLYGRGVSDDKAMLAANLEVFLQLKRLKVPLARDVIFLGIAQHSARDPKPPACRTPRGAVRTRA